MRYLKQCARSRPKISNKPSNTKPKSIEPRTGSPKFRRGPSIAYRPQILTSPNRRRVHFVSLRTKVQPTKMRFLWPKNVFVKMQTYCASEVMRVKYVKMHLSLTKSDEKVIFLISKNVFQKEERRSVAWIFK